ncbi:hypothetical protein [Clostridium estertheticum]|uniref:hypothetical protein n=1 Tax=Clostridium estertheticum TaxID=238834 RepID=UPI001C0CA8D0|nr:hypothetical protein [Clostridium estertheticum]MBU3186620.1 hypothetical protein [Clostridium estertheticum]
MFKHDNGTINKQLLTQPKHTEPLTYTSYGMVVGNGKQSTIYLKVGTNWQTYIITSNYKGFEPKLITTNKELTTTNYKSISIISVNNIKYTSTN